MLARSATIFKWTLYTLAGLVWAVVQAAFLQRVTVWGVIPFLYPLIAALPAIFEGPAAGTVYALACGVFCDLLLPSPIPCFYTLILPLVGLAAGLLSQSLIPAGYLCSAAAALPAYLQSASSTALSFGLRAFPHGVRPCPSPCGSCAPPCCGACL